MHGLTPPKLAARCRNTQPDASHERFCFELFRRAIVEGCSLSWHYLHNQYYSLVRYWVCRRAPLDPDTVDDLTQDAFTAFWRFYSPEKLAYAAGLGDVLSYLKSCAASAVAQAFRRQERAVVEEGWDAGVVDGCVSTPSAEASASRHLDAQSLWAIIEERCNDERDLLVARLTFVSGMKPSRIAELCPDLFVDVSQVHRVKRNLLDRLRRHPVLRSMHENRRNER